MVNIANLKQYYGQERMVQAFRAWHLLLQQAAHVATVTQIVENGSPSAAWRLFKIYFEPLQEADKARLTQEYLPLE